MWIWGHNLAPDRWLLLLGRWGPGWVLSKKRQDLICILIRIPLAPRQEGNRLGGGEEEGRRVGGGQGWDQWGGYCPVQAGSWWLDLGGMVGGAQQPDSLFRGAGPGGFPKGQSWRGAGEGGCGALASLSSRCLLCAALPPQERQARPQACWLRLTSPLALPSQLLAVDPDTPPTTTTWTNILRPFPPRLPGAPAQPEQTLGTCASGLSSGKSPARGRRGQPWREVGRGPPGPPHGVWPGRPWRFIDPHP